MDLTSWISEVWISDGEQARAGQGGSLCVAEDTLDEALQQDWGEGFAETSGGSIIDWGPSLPDAPPTSV